MTAGSKQRAHARPTEPTVSVVVPVFNAVDFVAAAVHSVLDQTFPDFELILIDDGSTDGSYELLQDLGASDERIVLLRQSNAGGAAARNAAIRVATGRYIALLDADDVALPDRLATQVSYLDHHADVTVVAGAVRHVDADGRPLYDYVGPSSSQEIAHALTTRLGSCIYDPTAMFRREAFVEVGGYRPQFGSAYDYDLWLRMLPRRLVNLPELMILYRRHERQTTHRRAELTLFSSTLAFASYQCRQRNEPDPVLKWAGDVDLELLSRLSLEPFALARLYAGLLLVRASDTGEETRERAQFTQEELITALTTVPWQRAQLSGDVEPLLRAASLLSSLGERRQGRRLRYNVVRYHPYNTVLALTRPLRRRVSASRPGSGYR